MSEPQRASVTTRRRLLAAQTLTVADTAYWLETSRYSIRKGVHAGEIPTVLGTARTIRVPASWVRERLGITGPADVPVKAGS